MTSLLAGACVSLVVLARATAEGGIQLLNTDVLGMPTSTAVKLLVEKGAEDAEPYVVWTDVACGEYTAASAFYRKPVTFAQARAALNKLYGEFETPRSFFERPNSASLFVESTDHGAVTRPSPLTCVLGRHG
jgi:hypothetical protein